MISLGKPIESGGFAGCAPTANGKGFQMSTKSPLFQDWIKAYDGKHPILDCGCAYGINSISAAKDGAQVIAVDMAQEHLQVLKDNVVIEGLEPKIKVLSPVTLPNNVSVPNESLSSILCAEVFHFLRGEEIEATLRMFYKILIPGGSLVITCSSIDFLRHRMAKSQTFPGLIDQLDKKWEDQSVKWPGEIDVKQLIAETYGSREEFQKAQKEHTGAPNNATTCEFFHVLSPEILTRALVGAGFQIEKCEQATHNGYPKAMQVDNSNIQVVATKIN